MREGNLFLQIFSTSDSFSRVFSSGEVFLSRNLETTFRCQMNLHDYPFDTQTCSMDIGSYSLTTDVLAMDFIHGPGSEYSPVEFDSNVELVSFDLLGHTINIYNETFSTGTYQAIKINFIFKRSTGFYILQVNQKLFQLGDIFSEMKFLRQHILCQIRVRRKKIVSLHLKDSFC